MKIDNWNIRLINTDIPYNTQLESILDYFKLTFNCSYLLNTQKNEFCILEKFIYDIINFHCNRLNININEQYIEFWFNRNSSRNNIHIDRSDYDTNINTNKNKEVPIFSCLTYMNSSNIPTIITNVTETEYNERNISNRHSLCISFPKQLKHICFDGGRYYHGNYDIFNENDNKDRFILVINLWRNRPPLVPYFDNSIISYILLCNSYIIPKNTLISKDVSVLKMEEPHNNIKTLCINNIFNYDFYNKLINCKTYKNVFMENPDILKNIRGFMDDYDMFMFKSTKNLIHPMDSRSSRSMTNEELNNSTECADLNFHRFTSLQILNEQGRNKLEVKELDIKFKLI